MALATVQHVIWPFQAGITFANMSAFSSNAQYQINGSGQRIGIIFQVPYTGTITKLGIRINTCASAQTSRLGLYTVDASGNPTSSTYGGSTYATFTPAATTYSEVTLGTPATATVGDVVAMIVEFDSTAGDMFVTSPAQTGNTALILPGITKYGGASWARSTSGGGLQGHIYYSDSSGLYPFCGAYGISGGTGGATFNSGSTPDEYGNLITVPFKCRCSGIWTCYQSAAGANFDAVLYSGTTALATASMDGDVIFTTANMIRMALFATPVTLTAGTSYVAAIKPTTANDVSRRYYTLAAAGSGQSLGFSKDVQSYSRTDAGAWTTSATTTIESTGIIIDQLDDGASAGGGVWMPRARQVGV